MLFVNSVTQFCDMTLGLKYNRLSFIFFLIISFTF